MPHHANVLILTALKEEFDALMMVDNGAAHGSSWEHLKTADRRIYAQRTFTSEDGRQTFQIAASWATRMGEVAAISALYPLKEALNPKCIAMCGVCAGKSGDTERGDVIFADLLFDYGAGKKVMTYDENGIASTQSVKLDLLTHQPHPRWVQAAQAFQPPRDWLRDAPRPVPLDMQGYWILKKLYGGEDIDSLIADPSRREFAPDWKFALDWLTRRSWISDFCLTGEGKTAARNDMVVHPDGRPSARPWRLLTGPIATGSKVLEDEHIFDHLSQSVRKVLGLEMEACAIGAVAWDHQLPFVVMKSVMDHATPDKDDRYKSFAARASAECLVAFLRHTISLVPGGAFGSPPLSGPSADGNESRATERTGEAGNAEGAGATGTAFDQAVSNATNYATLAQNDVAQNLRTIAQELCTEQRSWRAETQSLRLGEFNYVHHVTDVVGTFALFATSRSVPVDSSYVNVNVSRDIERERYRSVSEIALALRMQCSERTDCGDEESGTDPLQAVALSTRGFALIGNPGSGKTTIFRWLAIHVARGLKLNGAQRVAIYLAVRDLIFVENDQKLTRHPVIDGAQRYAESLGVDRPGAVLQMLLATGRCAILLDGLDETDSERQSIVLQELASIQARWPRCFICVSARPHSLSQAVPGFVKWETVPLSYPSRITFVNKWFSHVDPAKGQRLLERCKSSPRVLELGSSPLLLSIVCALFDHDLDIPSDPGELYARAVEGMLGGWDAFRNIARRSPLANLSLRTRLVLVATIAFEMFERSKIVFSARDVEQSGCLRSVAMSARTSVPLAEYTLASLYNDFGILVERSPGLYSFSHLTIHEHLVARHVVDIRKELPLCARVADPEWHEVIRMVARLLPQADDYMRTLHQLVRATSRSAVILLNDVWRSRPLVSEGVRKVLISQLARNVGATVGSIACGFELDQGTLYIKAKDVRTLALARAAMRRRSDHVATKPVPVDADSAEEAVPRKEPSKKPAEAHGQYAPLAMLECLPELLGIISDSGFTPEDLGVGTNALYKYLSTKPGADLSDVAVVGLDVADDATPAQPRKKRHDWNTSVRPHPNRSPGEPNSS